MDLKVCPSAFCWKQKNYKNKTWNTNRLDTNKFIIDIKIY